MLVVSFRIDSDASVGLEKVSELWYPRQHHIQNFFSPFINIVASFLITSHMTFNRSLFTTYPTGQNSNIAMGTREIILAAVKESVTFTVFNDQCLRTINLTDVLDVPEFGFSSLSVSAFGKTF